MRKECASIVICSFNAGDVLYDSVRTSLNQTTGNHEVIVVNDGSTDGSVDTLAELKDERLRIVWQENAGKAAAMNHALEVANGEYCVIQDADDLSHPERVERLLDAFSVEPQLGAVQSGYDLLIDARHVAPISKRKAPEECAADIDAFRMPSHDPTIMFRTELGRQLGFDEALRIGQGYDFILRLGEVAPMRVIPDVLYSYRVSFESITRRDPTRRAKFVRLVREKACKRRGVSYDDVFGTDAGANVSKDNGLAAHVMESVVCQKRDGQALGALKTACQGIRFQPLSARYYQALAYSMMPYPLLTKIRGRR